jgi:hypothetical protein
MAQLHLHTPLVALPASVSLHWDMRKTPDGRVSTSLHNIEQSPVSRRHLWLSVICGRREPHKWPTQAALRCPESDQLAIRMRRLCVAAHGGFFEAVSKRLSWLYRNTTKDSILVVFPPVGSVSPSAKGLRNAVLCLPIATENSSST